MKLLILSDIHGNVSAFEQVLKASLEKHPDAVAFLGDFIDYGMRSNQIIEMIEHIDLPIVCNIWGNHEQAIMLEDYSRFSSKRGADCAKFTREHLSPRSCSFLNDITAKSGSMTFEFQGKYFLAVHGSLEDAYWKALDFTSDLTNYAAYDYVLSGHSHIPHIFSKFYAADAPNMRNRKKTVFINPGSVGQPRNHDPAAQYAILDFETGVTFYRVPYDIKYEQSLYPKEIDAFYKTRLQYGV